ncbi:MAG: protein DpdH, partial [Polyangiaceae bacterium]
MSFAGHLCWRPEGVDDIVVYDAVMPSEAVFLATHTSSPILRGEFQSTDMGTRCTEEELLSHLLDTPGHLLFVPIVGQSGRGKSHLVRWFRVNIPPSDARHVVYIPKYNTNLRGVVEEILRGLPGTAADKLREDLARAADDVDESTAPEKLLYALALRVQRHTAAGQDPVDGTRPALAKKDVEARHFAVKWLPELLRDHTFRDSILAKETGVITRFAREAIHGRSKGDREKPFSFGEEDLPLDVSSVRHASDAIRKFYGQLVSSVSLRAACITLLNEHLGPAVAEVIGLRSGELYRILLDLRRLLLEQKKELVLLIEDFTVLQGVQKELLDALIETPLRNGKQVLCNVRAAVAVTTGRFLSDFETVLTRAKFNGYLFHLDVPVTETSAGKAMKLNEVVDFVGAYLNACRLGRPAIEDAHTAAGDRGRRDGNWIANACEKCPHEARCRGAFGRTSRGYGLYPFNEHALERMVRARSDGFDPREILGQVVRYTLESHGEDIRQGGFPSMAFAAHFKSDRVTPISAALETSLRQDKEPRRLPLLVFWGGNPKEPINLPEPVHEAFRISRRGDAETVA